MRVCRFPLFEAEMNEVLTDVLPANECVPCSVVTGRAGPTGWALDHGPEARRAFEVGPRAGQKPAKIGENKGKFRCFWGFYHAQFVRHQSLSSY